MLPIKRLAICFNLLINGCTNSDLLKQDKSFSYTSNGDIGNGDSPNLKAENRGNDRNGTVKTVKIAIIDTGLNKSRLGFKSPISTNSMSMIGVSDDTSDNSGHGTAVASIIGASSDGTGFGGIAQNSALLILKASSEQNTFNSKNLGMATGYAIDQNAHIINLSVSGKYEPSLSFKNKLAEAVNQGALIVVAAGNDASPQPGYPGLLAGTFTGPGKMITVGAVDKSSKISTFSNRAGPIKEHFLVAPGVEVSALNQNGEKIKVSGTSFSAPLVSGAAALIKEASPYLTGRQVAEILLSSATDLGAVGVDAVYGHGLLNVKAALGPIEPAFFTAASGSQEEQQKSNRVADTYLILDKVFANRLAENASLSDVMALDKYKRTFFYDMRTAVYNYRKNEAENLKSWLHQRNDITVSRLAIKSFSPQSSALGKNSLRIGLLNIARVETGKTPRKWYSSPNQKAGFTTGLEGNFLGFVGQIGNKSSFVTSFGLPVATHMGLAGHGADLGNNAWENPFLAFTGTDIAQSYTYQPNNTVSIKFAYGLTGEQTTLATEAYWQINKQFHLSAGSGTLQESSTLLNSSGSGAFSLENGTETSFNSLSASYRYSPQLTFYGTYSQGFTKGFNQDKGFFKSVSDLKSQGFAFGFQYENLASQAGLGSLFSGKLFNPSDRFFKDSLSLLVSQPLRIKSGSMTLSLPKARDSNGNITVSEEKIDLTPGGRELNFDIDYNLSTTESKGRSHKLGFTTGFSYQSDHNEDAPLEGRIGIKYETEF